jgi:hypothetical protein
MVLSIYHHVIGLSQYKRFSPILASGIVSEFSPSRNCLGAAVENVLGETRFRGGWMSFLRHLVSKTAYDRDDLMPLPS